MTAYRNNAKFAGAMFLTAMAASLAGGTMVQTSGDDTIVMLGAVLEIINALAVIGIIAAFWEPLRKQHPSMMAGYMGVRILESVSCALAAFIPVVIMKLGGATDTSMLTIIRDSVTAYAVPVFFGVGGMLLYTMLYRSKIVPRYISAWGFLASIGVMLVMLVPIVAIKPVLALPIIINEIYLGIYLIIKGFIRDVLPPL